MRFLGRRRSGDASPDGVGHDRRPGSLAGSLDHRDGISDTLRSTIPLLSLQRGRALEPSRAALLVANGGRLIFELGR
jgi:hypothetical protein